MTSAHAIDLVNSGDYLTQVREHYEQYPYPPRDPANEKNIFQYAQMSALDCLNHYHFGGKRDFSKRFRALAAGDGTGDATIMLAEQLRDFDSEIIYLDISEASLQIAKERARIRGLTNITWVHGSVLNAPQMLEGEFDYINCSGVLHHLASPEDGLAALTSLLKDDGVMGLMLYARYGREGVYQMQSLMRLLNGGEENMQTKVENCKAMLKNLPPSSAFWHVEDLLREVQEGGDIGIYDLLLHSNDVAYSIPELYRFLASSQLYLNYLFFSNHPEGNHLYNPEYYNKDGSLTPLLQKLNKSERQAAAELMHGKIIKHVFYAAKMRTAPPSLEDKNDVPYFCMVMDPGAYQRLHTLLIQNPIGHQVSWQVLDLKVSFTNTPHLARICKFLDGKRSIAEILDATLASYAGQEAPKRADIMKEFAALYAAFNTQNWMYLRDQHTPSVKTIMEIINRQAL